MPAEGALAGHAGATRGDCARVVRITAHADLKEVEMKIDQVIDRQEAVSYTIVMSALPPAEALIHATGSAGAGSQPLSTGNPLDAGARRQHRPQLGGQTG